MERGGDRREEGGEKRGIDIASVISRRGEERSLSESLK